MDNKHLHFLRSVFIFLAVLFIHFPVFAQDTLTVMSYNIHHAAGMDGVVNVNRIAKIIQQAAPDVVALQEVDSCAERSYRTDQPAALGDLTGLQYTFGKNLNFQGGGYGNAVLYQDSTAHWRNLWLPIVNDGEQRGVLYAELNIGQSPVLFLATHFDHRENDTERLASVAAMDSLMTSLGIQRVILVGDLNDTPGSPTITAIQKNLGLQMSNAATADSIAYTFPADDPVRTIDYIFLSPGIKVLSFQVLEEPTASDHRPVAAKIVLP